MSSILNSRFRFIIYIVVGYVLIVACALLTGATMPLIIDNFTYQGRGGYEGLVGGSEDSILSIYVSHIIPNVEYRFQLYYQIVPVTPAN